MDQQIQINGLINTNGFLHVIHNGSIEIHNGSIEIHNGSIEIHNGSIEYIMDQ